MVPEPPPPQAEDMTTTPPIPPTSPRPPTPPPAAPAAAPAPGPGPAPEASGPRVGLEQVRDLSRLRRTVGAERSVAGVAGGLGRHLDIDPVLLKVAFVVLSFFGGVGLLLYAVCWLLIPDERATTAPLGLDDRSRGIALVVTGAVAAVALLGTTLGVDVVPLPLVVLAVLGLVVVLQVDKRRQRRTGAAPLPAPDSSPSPSPSDPSDDPMDNPADDTTEDTAYDPAPTGAAPASWATAPYPPMSPPAPVLRRKPGPILFWFTLALAALGIGVLATLDLAGVAVAGPAYPALVLALTGAMLVLGAFWGRAGGLILVGLLTTPVLVGSMLAQAYDGVDRREAPTSAADVAPAYSFESGQLLLDLSDVVDVAALDGRTVTVTGEVGSIEVVVPEGIGITARAEIEGPGVVDVLGAESGGLSADRSFGADPANPVQLRVETSLGVGAIDIRTTPERTDR